MAATTPYPRRSASASICTVLLSEIVLAEGMMASGRQEGFYIGETSSMVAFVEEQTSIFSKTKSPYLDRLSSYWCCMTRCPRNGDESFAKQLRWLHGCSLSCFAPPRMLQVLPRHRSETSVHPITHLLHTSSKQHRQSPMRYADETSLPLISRREVRRKQQVLRSWVIGNA